MNKFEKHVQSKNNDVVDSGLGFIVGFFAFCSIILSGGATKLTYNVRSTLVAKAAWLRLQSLEKSDVEDNVDVVINIDDNVNFDIDVHVEVGADVQARNTL